VPVIPADLKYGQDHMWARASASGGLVRVGLTDFAQDSLGDVVDVGLPGVGDTVDAGEPCGDIESVKSANDLIAPITGTVRGRNDELADAPELVNSDPYGQGWMFEIETDATTLETQLGALLDAHAYGALTGA
jgi:glycine cleavage system H protein